MKIVALLTDVFGAVGGIQTFNRSLAKALDEIAQDREWKVSLLVLNDRREGVEAHSYFNGYRTRYRPFGHDKRRFAFAAFRESLDADVVVVGHVNFTPLALGLPSLRGLKVLLVVYGVEVWRRLPLLQLLGVRRASRILSISGHTRTMMESHNRLDGARFDIVPPSLDPISDTEIKLRSREELALPLGHMILSVARLKADERYKGIDRVIEALPAVLEVVPDAFYVVVGDGTDRDRLERLARDMEVGDKVIFAGRVDDGLLASFYDGCDVFVLPSWGEGFGIVFLEAMYFSKACVGARAGAIPEVIAEGETGLLIDPKNTDSLADSIIRMLEDESLRRGMGDAGKERLEREFSFQAYRRRIETALLS